MKLYGGLDLHSTNTYIVLVDETGKIVLQTRLNNELELLLKELEPHKSMIEGLVVESTYNWYWLVDGLQAAGYQLHLANTAANVQYNGIKYTDDKSDAIWLAELLRLKVLKEGYIYPKEQRGLRELLRRRMVLVRQRTMSLLGIQAMICRYQGIRVSGDKIKRMLDSDLLAFIHDKNVAFSVKSQLTILNCVMEQVSVLEKEILSQTKSDRYFQLLQTVPGIGNILALTILIETGDISRFKKVGNYSSYCRCVESKRISNGKKKAENNKKNGNGYLSWAFIEAANFAIRYNEDIKKYYQKKLAKTKRVVAIKTIAHKLARACYFILKDGVKFDVTKAFI